MKREEKLTNAQKINELEQKNGIYLENCFLQVALPFF